MFYTVVKTCIGLVLDLSPPVDNSQSVCLSDIVFVCQSLIISIPFCFNRKYTVFISHIQPVWNGSVVNMVTVCKLWICHSEQKLYRWLFNLCKTILKLMLKIVFEVEKNYNLGKGVLSLINFKTKQCINNNYENFVFVWKRCLKSENITLRMSTLTEGIIKINSKALESSELKKLDKQEKELIFQNLGNVKGNVTFPNWELMNHTFFRRRRPFFPNVLFRTIAVR